MRSPFQFFRPDRAADDAQVRMIRDVLASCMEALRLPVPDTFVGRKIQEPFPKEDDQAGGWLDSNGLQPHK